MSAIETQILKYLTDHPKASDTLEGIAQWWIRDRSECTAEQVRLVLDRLVRTGVLSVRFESSGRGHYKLEKNCLGDSLRVVPFSND